MLGLCILELTIVCVCSLVFCVVYLVVCRLYFVCLDYGVLYFRMWDYEVLVLVCCNWYSVCVLYVWVWDVANWHFSVSIYVFVCVRLLCYLMLLL